MKFKDSFTQHIKSRPFYKRSDCFPIFLLFLSFLIFGVLTPFLGFYWDDFPYLWFDHTKGPTGVYQAIALDRPALGIFYLLPMTILGNHPLIWQIFSIFCRWIFTISTYGFLNAIWPQQGRLNQWIILLFLVYPGFSQQWISVIYSHIFLIFALYFYSLTLFVNIIRSRPKNYLLYTLLSLGISVFCMTAVEYVVGLEIIRPLVILNLQKNKEKTGKRNLFRNTMRLWLPYLLGVGLFVIYRLFFAQSVLYTPQILPSESGAIVQTVSRIFTVQFQNVWTSIISAWRLIIQPLENINFSSKITFLYVALTGVYFLIAYLFVTKISSPSEFSSDSKWIRESIIGSLIVLYFAGIPFSAANLRPDTQFPSDRFLLPFMLASSIIIVALLLLIRKKKVLFSLLFSLIFAFSASFHFFTADTYRKDWESFESFFQQFNWRVPAIEENTLFITNDMPLRYYSDNSLTAPLNWIYAMGDIQKDLPYLMNFTDVRLGHSLGALEPGISIKHPYRIYTFNGSTDQMVFFYFDPPGCFHIADPEIDVYNPLISDDIRYEINLSNYDWIKSETHRNSPFFLNDDALESWCYYYQKASLAAQNQDWPLVVRYAEKAFALDDYPNDASERMPFIEGYAMSGNYEKAMEQSHLTHNISELYDPMLCALWDRILSHTAPNEGSLAGIEGMLAQFACHPN